MVCEFNLTINIYLSGKRAHLLRTQHGNDVDEFLDSHRELSWISEMGSGRYEQVVVTDMCRVHSRAL